MLLATGAGFPPPGAGRAGRPPASVSGAGPPGRGCWPASAGPAAAQPATQNIFIVISIQEILIHFSHPPAADSPWRRAPVLPLHPAPRELRPSHPSSGPSCNQGAQLDIAIHFSFRGIRKDKSFYRNMIIPRSTTSNTLLDCI